MRNSGNDLPQHAFKGGIVQNVARSEAQGSNAALGQPGIPPCVPVRLFSNVMHRPVHLERKPGMRTIEVEDERADWVLPAKAHPRNPATAEALPKNYLGQRHVAAKLSSPVESCS